MNFDEKIGERLKNCRVQLGMRQSDLAELVGVAPVQIYRYESGRVQPRLDTIGKLALALNVNPQWLAGGIESIERATSNDTIPESSRFPKLELDLPNDLSEQIKLQAAKNNRTVEMEIIAAILKGLSLNEDLKKNSK